MREGELQEPFEKEALSYERNQKLQKITEYCLTIPRTFIQDCEYFVLNKPARLTPSIYLVTSLAHLHFTLVTDLSLFPSFVEFLPKTSGQFDKELKRH